jgi:hypothetical protein
MKKLIFVSQGALQFFVGVGALISGALLIIAPSGSLLHTPPEMLKGSPFHDFLFPGIILFLVNGVGQLVAGMLTLRRHPSAGFVGAVFGMGLMIWIFVQVNMIGGGHILQYSYYFLGVVETVLSFSMHRYLVAREEGQGQGGRGET